MYCTNCGAKNANDAKFCGHCGASLTAQKTVAPVKVNFEPAAAEQKTVSPAPDPAPTQAAAPVQTKAKGSTAKLVLTIGRLGAILCAAMLILGVFVPAIAVRTDIINPAPNSTITPTASSLGLDEDLSLAGLNRDPKGDGLWLVLPAGAVIIFSVAGITSLAAVSGIAAVVYSFGLLGEIKHMLNVPGAVFFIKAGPAYPLLLIGALLMFIFIIVEVVGRIMVRYQERNG